jgi:integrase
VRPAPSLTFPGFAERKYKPVARARVAPSWWTTIDYQLAVLSKAFPGPLDTITPEAVERWWARLQLRAARGALSPGYCNKFLTRLRAVFKKAVQWGYLSRNPTYTCDKLRERPGRERWFSDDQWAWLLDHAGDKLKVYMVLAHYTAARRMACWDLRKEDVDLAHDTITLRNKGQRGVRLVRHPLDPRLRAVLEPLMTGHPNHRLLPRLRLDSLSHEFRKLIARGHQKRPDLFPDTDFTFHDLRHDVASHLAMQGVDIRVIQAVLGHADLRMTSRYTHLRDRSLVAQALARLR